MKLLVTTVLFFLCSLKAFSLEPRDGFNVELMKIYNSLISKGSSQELIGKTFTALLSVKLANEKHLIFNDAYIETSDSESYQIAKWEFSPATIKGIVSNSGAKLNITFKVLNVRKSHPYRDMPHIIAKVLKASPIK